MLERKSQALLSLQDQGDLYHVDMSFKDRLKRARKAARPKLTQAAIASALRVTPQAVSGWERGEAMPETDKLISLSEILKVEVGYLLGEGAAKAVKNGTSAIVPEVPAKNSLIATKPSHGKVSVIADSAVGVVPASELVGEQDLPVFGTAEGGRGALIVTDRPVDYVVRPAPLLRVREGYGMIVTGDSMSPAIESGWTALVNPHLPPRPGDICIFRSHQDDGTVLACIKRLRRFNDAAWHVHQLNPKRDFVLKRVEWQICHVTVGSFYGR